MGGSAGVRAPGRAHSGTQELQAKGLLHQWRPEMFVILGVDDPPQPRVCVCVCVCHPLYLRVPPLTSVTKILNAGGRSASASLLPTKTLAIGSETRPDQSGV